MAKKNRGSKKNNKKIVITVTVVMLLVIVGSCGYFFYNSKKLSIKLNKLEASLNSEIYSSDFIKSIKNGKIISKKEKIDTSKIGTQKFVIKVKDYFNNTKELTYVVSIVDNEAPTIKFSEKLTTREGSTLDLLKGVEATDNSGEEIAVEIEGEYDFNKIGKYELSYVASDSSGNKATEKFTLEVIEKEKEPAPVDNTTYFTTSKGFQGFVKDGVTYVDGYLIANKTYTLPDWYYPGGLTWDTENAFNQMKAAAANEGLNLWVASGFRSYWDQNWIYNNYVANDGQANADTYSARPGHSEHQSGMAMDINMVDSSFEYTAEGQWLNNNAYKYGFILRYPKDKSYQTGYMFEPWHYRYVGTSLASKLYNNGDWITMEDYFGITSQYNY